MTPPKLNEDHVETKNEKQVKNLFLNYLIFSLYLH